MTKYWKEILITLLTSGFLGQAIGLWDVSIKREDSYIDKYVNSQIEIVELNRKYDAILNRLVTLELATYETPFPYWVKDKNSVIIWINKEYKETILKSLKISPENFVNTRGEMLGDKFVSDVVANDLEVIRSKKVMSFNEVVPTLGDGVSYKFPVFNNFGLVIGTAGIWIPNNPKF